jgi:hypothetical protein
VSFGKKKDNFFQALFFSRQGTFKKKMDFKLFADMYVCGDWSLTQKRGFNTCSGVRGFYAEWFNEGEQWSPAILTALSSAKKRS